MNESTKKIIKDNLKRSIRNFFKHQKNPNYQVLDDITNELDSNNFQQFFSLEFTNSYLLSIVNFNIPLSYLLVIYYTNY